MTEYIPAATAALFGKDMNLGVFLKVNHTTDPLRLWLGVNDVPQHFDAIELDDEIYHGAGRLISIPDIEAIINGVAQRVEYTTEGISADAASRIEAANVEVKGKKVMLGFAKFDSRWQPVTPIFAINHSIADFWSLSANVVTGGTPQTYTLALSCSSGETGRSRPRRTTYTDAQQKHWYSAEGELGDGYCRHVVRYDRGFTLSWPRF